MGVKFGEIDSGQILENEFRIAVLEATLEGLMNNNPDLKLPTQYDLKDIQNQVLEKLKKKYPNSGLALRGEKNEG